MSGTSAWNNNWNVMDSNYGPVDIRRNTGLFLIFFSPHLLDRCPGNLQTMSLCCWTAGGSHVCGLGTHNSEDLDEHL